MAAKSTNVATATPSADQFVAEYMANYMNKPRVAKASIIDRITTAVENRVLNTVADSKAFGARVAVAWDVADDLAEQAALKERQRQAIRMAQRLGLN